VTVKDVVLVVLGAWAERLTKVPILSCPILHKGTDLRFLWQATLGGLDYCEVQTSLLKIASLPEQLVQRRVDFRLTGGMS